MKIASFNANGLRAALKKGVADFINQQEFDIICIQELKAQPLDLNLPDKMHTYHVDDKVEYNLGNLIPGYYFCGQYAQKKGYSGVGIFSKHKPQIITYGIQDEKFQPFNLEGRYIQINFNNLPQPFDDLCLVNCYFPSGSVESKLQSKFDFLDIIYPHLIKLQQQHENLILCGDINIAHNEIDLKNWKGNLKNPGFLPQERQWITKLLANGYNDILRMHNPDKQIYTWWSQRGQAFNNDVGWRIDYHFLSNNLVKSCKNIIVYKQPRFSDHAIVVAEFA